MYVVGFTATLSTVSGQIHAWSALLLSRLPSITRGVLGLGLCATKQAAGKDCAGCAEPRSHGAARAKAKVIESARACNRY